MRRCGIPTRAAAGYTSRHTGTSREVPVFVHRERAAFSQHAMKSLTGVDHEVT